MKLIAVLAIAVAGAFWVGCADPAEYAADIQLICASATLDPSIQGQLKTERARVNYMELRHFGDAQQKVEYLRREAAGAPCPAADALAAKLPTTTSR